MRMHASYSTCAPSRLTSRASAPPSQTIGRAAAGRSSATSALADGALPVAALHVCAGEGPRLAVGRVGDERPERRLGGCGVAGLVGAAHGVAEPEQAGLGLGFGALAGPPPLDGDDAERQDRGGEARDDEQPGDAEATPALGVGVALEGRQQRRHVGPARVRVDLVRRSVKRPSSGRSVPGSAGRLAVSTCVVSDRSGARGASTVLASPSVAGRRAVVPPSTIVGSMPCPRARVSVPRRQTRVLEPVAR